MADKWGEITEVVQLLYDHYGDVRLRYSTRCVRLGNISRTPSLIEETYTAFFKRRHFTTTNYLSMMLSSYSDLDFISLTHSLTHSLPKAMLYNRDHKSTRLNGPPGSAMPNLWVLEHSCPVSQSGDPSAKSFFFYLRVSL